MIEYSHARNGIPCERGERDALPASACRLPGARRTLGGVDSGDVLR